MEKVVRKFRSFREADEADLRFYRSLSGNERVNILLELVRQATADETTEGFKRVYRIVKLPRR